MNFYSNKSKGNNNKMKILPQLQTPEIKASKFKTRVRSHKIQSVHPESLSEYCQALNNIHQLTK
jgi:hypothetical protein